jgi:hypothetical protein
MAIPIGLFVVSVRTLIKNNVIKNNVIKNNDMLDYTSGISIDLFYNGYALGI